MRFLIVKPSSLGDILHAFPAVEALRKAYPGAVIDWVVNPAFAGLLDYMPGIDRRILFRRKELGKWNTFFSEFFSLWKEIRKNSYDAVIDLQGLMRSALVARLAKAPEYYGPGHVKENLAKLCYSKKLSYPPDVFHAVERNCEMIRQIPGVAEADPYFGLPVLPEQKEKAEKLLAAEGFTRKSDASWIAVAPGARWVTKQWPPEFFAEVMRGIAEKRSRVSFLLLGSPAEKGLAETIRQALLHNNLPTSTSYTAEEIAAGVLKDKKRRGGEISFVLPTKIGHCEIVKIPTEEVLDLVRTALA